MMPLPKATNTNNQENQVTPMESVCCSQSCCSRYLNEVASYVSSCDVQPPGQVRQGEALVHWTDVSDAVS